MTTRVCAFRHFWDGISLNHIFSQPFLHRTLFQFHFCDNFGITNQSVCKSPKCLFSIFTPVFSTDLLKHLNFRAKNAKSFFFTSLLLLKLSEEEILNNINVFPPTPEKLGTLPNTPATPVTERRGRLAPLTLFQQSWQGQSLKLASASSHLLFKTTPTTSTQKSWKSFDHRGSNLSILGYLSLLPHTLLAEWTLCKKYSKKVSFLKGCFCIFEPSEVVTMLHAILSEFSLRVVLSKFLNRIWDVYTVCDMVYLNAFTFTQHHIYLYWWCSIKAHCGKSQF